MEPSADIGMCCAVEVNTFAHRGLIACSGLDRNKKSASQLQLLPSPKRLVCILDNASFDCRPTLLVVRWAAKQPKLGIR